MAKACDKARCPARADVDDAVTTEYRKGCRRTPCTRANTLSVQRRRAAKAEAAIVVGVEGLAAALDADPPPADPAGFDLVAAVRADLEQLDPQHPLTRSLSSVALALATNVQLQACSATGSAASSAKQLVAVLEKLLPAAPSMADELESFLASLQEDDDEPAAAQ
jgi:hypothetical protein